MSDWISVDDRLPESFEDVLVWEKYSIRPFVGFYSNSKKWVSHKDFVAADGDCGLTCNIDQDLVTHWQPLPPPPEN